jgi:hypothetical protein
VARPGREPGRVARQGRPGDGHRPLAVAQLGDPRGRQAVGHRAGGRRGRHLPEVGYRQGRADQPTRQRRREPRPGACRQAGRRLQRRTSDLLNGPPAPSAQLRALDSWEETRVIFWRTSHLSAHFTQRVRPGDARTHPTAGRRADRPGRPSPTRARHPHRPYRPTSARREGRWMVADARQTDPAPTRPATSTDAANGRAQSCGQIQLFVASRYVVQPGQPCALMRRQVRIGRGGSGGNAGHLAAAGPLTSNASFLSSTDGSRPRAQSLPAASDYPADRAGHDASASCGHFVWHDNFAHSEVPARDGTSLGRGLRATTHQEQRSQCVTHKRYANGNARRKACPPIVAGDPGSELH